MRVCCVGSVRLLSGVCVLVSCLLRPPLQATTAGFDAWLNANSRGENTDAKMRESVRKFCSPSKAISCV